MPDPSAPITWGLIGSFGTFSVVVGGLIAKAWPLWHKADAVLSDLLGEDARPGVARRPGVMERLASVETAVSDQGTALSSLAAAQTQRATAEQEMAAEIADLRERLNQPGGTP